MAPGRLGRVDVTIERYGWASDLAPGDLAAVNRIHNAAWDEWIPGERPLSEAALVDFDRFSAPPERMDRALARAGNGMVLGLGLVYWRAGPGGCTLRMWVDVAHRRTGVASALGTALAEIAAETGRTGINVSVAPGSAADAAVRQAEDFRPGLIVELNRTAVASIDRALLERWREEGEAAAGYSLVAYDAPCPTDELACQFVRAREVINEAPRPEGIAAADYTVEELRAVEMAGIAAHQDWWNVGVRHDATGDVVGHTELYLPANRPWMASQGDTAVHPDHRGHRLGAWLKAVNHLRLADERPEVEWVQTWNAESNEPMLRINRALGFAPVQRFQNWFRPLP
jgi:GNAT superfamily N-acetyltransferase